MQPKPTVEPRAVRLMFGFWQAITFGRLTRLRPLEVILFMLGYIVAMAALIAGASRLVMAIGIAA